MEVKAVLGVVRLEVWGHLTKSNGSGTNDLLQRQVGQLSSMGSWVCRLKGGQARWKDPFPKAQRTLH